MPRSRSRSTRHRSEPDPTARRIGATIRRLRTERGISFDAFVEETGLGRGYISELERGLVVPTVTSLRKVARVLEVTMADREQLFEALLGMPAPELERLLRALKGPRKGSGVDAKVLRTAESPRRFTRRPEDK
jgi:transcriptional regulator with XRE-family HTH domain